MPADVLRSNARIFAYALYRLQGSGQYVHVEDIYVECWRLSPSRFGWRKYPYPNYKTTAKALQTFEAANSDLIIKSPDGLGRQLTAPGVAWVRQRLGDFQRLASGETRAPAAKRASSRAVAQLTRHPTVRAFIAGKEPELRKVDVADLLSCAPDSAPSVWQQRLATFRSAAEDDERPDLARFLEYIEQTHSNWFVGR
jgi:hypothetical protein